MLLLFAPSPTDTERGRTTRTERIFATRPPSPLRQIAWIAYAFAKADQAIGSLESGIGLASSAESGQNESNLNRGDIISRFRINELNLLPRTAPITWRKP